MSKPEGQAPEADAVKGVVKVKKFKSEGDFVNQILSENAMENNTEGKVIGVSVEKLKRLAKENGLKHRESYPNPGMWRMNIGNMLRAKARREGKLLVNGQETRVPGWAPKAAPPKKIKAA